MAEEIIFFSFFSVSVVLMIAFFQNPYLILLMPISIIPFFPAIQALFTAPFVPSKRIIAAEMVKLGNIKQEDIVYDLGAGDGRIVDLAAKQGAFSTGYELSLVLVGLHKIKEILSKKSGKVLWGNIWKRDYRDANEIFIYLSNQAMEKFAREIYPTLAVGTKIVSNTFQFKDIKPVKVQNKLYLYIKS